MINDKLEVPNDPQSLLSWEGIAPWWHSLLVLAMFVLWALLSHGTVSAYASRPHWQVYVSMAMMQVVVLGTVVSGVYHRRQFFLGTLFIRAQSWWREFARGVGLYLMSLLLAWVVAVLLRRMGYHLRSRSTVFETILPDTWFELLLWAIASVTIGFCEEHIMRGYLLRQLRSWGRHLGLMAHVTNVCAVLASAIIFGSLHAYEGSRGVLAICVLGVVYALAVLRFGNLRAVIIAHALQDFTAILFMALRLGTLG